MELREFVKYHLFKVLIGLVILQLVIVAFVQNFNHRPVANADQTDMIEDRTSKISPLINDTDKDDGTELSLEGFSDPLHGSVKQQGNVFYYTPVPNFAGRDSFTYTINDGKKVSYEAYISINVHKNQVPVVTNDSLYLYAGTSMNLEVLDNDSDEENDSLFITEYSQPQSGKLTLQDNAFRYTAGTSGGITDAFTYVVSDGKNTSSPATVQIEILGKNDARYPWLSADLGDAAIPGSFGAKAGKLTIVGSGSDIWNNFDGFRFVYQPVKGDFDMTIKAESLEGTNEWAKVGIMARESLDGGSKHAFVLQSNRNGITYHQRMEQDQFTQGGQGNGEISAPSWLRLQRKGDNFTYMYSTDGASWTEMATVEVPLSGEVYLGVAVTSHNNAEQAKAVVSGVKLIQ